MSPYLQVLCNILVAVPCSLHLIPWVIRFPVIKTYDLWEFLRPVSGFFLPSKHTANRYLRHVFGRQGLVHRELNTTSPLPPRLGNPSRTRFIQSSSRIRKLITAKRDDKRSDILRLQRLDDIFWHYRSGHGGASSRCYSVDVDIVFCAFQCQRSTKAQNASFLMDYQSLSSPGFGARADLLLQRNSTAQSFRKFLLLT